MEIAPRPRSPSLLQVDMQVSSLPVQPGTLATSDLGRCHHRGVTHTRDVSVLRQQNIVRREAWHIQKHLVWSSLHKSRQPQRTHKRPRVTVQASSSSRQRNIQEIPIFPLGMVALPGAVTPLNIFEARYGLLTHTPQPPMEMSLLLRSKILSFYLRLQV